MCPPLASRQRKGGWTGSGSRKSEATWPCRWSTGASGSRSAQASAFAAESPTRSAPISPGPRVTAMRSTSVSSAPRLAERLADDRRDELEVPARRDLRDDASVAGVEVGLRGDDVRADLAVVGDQRRGGLVTRRLEPEDQALAGSRTGSFHMIERVFAVVRVVAPADSPGAEAELFVEPDRGLVRDAHLERVAAAGVPGRDLEQALHEPARDPLAAVLRRDRDVHHVPGVDVAGDDQVADELVPLAVDRAEADRGRLRQLAREHRARPRRGIRRALDLLDRVQVAQLQLPELDHHRSDLSASGART